MSPQVLSANIGEFFSAVEDHEATHSSQPKPPPKNPNMLQRRLLTTSHDQTDAHPVFQQQLPCEKIFSTPPIHHPLLFSNIYHPT